MIAALIIIAYVLFGIGSVMLDMYLESKELGYVEDNESGTRIAIFFFWPLFIIIIGIVYFFEWYKDILEDNVKEDKK